MMSFTLKIAQLVLSLGLLNVWLLRFSKATAYRGGSAKTMREEFAVYGLPEAMLYVVGGLKLLVAVLMIVGFWLPVVVAPAAAVVSILMIGAILMHLKVKDPVIRFVPALGVFLLSLFIAFASSY
jgi:hypothetical protein